MRIDVALVYRDGRREVVTVGRPADLIAFADKFDKMAPDGPRSVFEVAWITHRTLRASVPLEEWIEQLDEITADEEEVAKVRAALPPTAAPTALPVREAEATSSELASLG